MVLGLFLQACVIGPQRTILKAADRQGIQSISLYNLVIQDEVKPAVNLSNATQAGMAFGALGALITASIDSSVNKGRAQIAEELADPLLDAAMNVDARQILQTELNASLESLYPLKEKRALAEAVFVPNTKLRSKFAQLEQGQYLLYVSNFYELIDDSKTLRVNATASMYKKPKQNGNQDSPGPVYYNAFSYKSAPVGNGAADSIAAWSDKDAQLFVAALKDAAREIAWSLKYDLQNNVTMECGKMVSITVPAINGGTFANDAVVIDKRPDRTIVRSAVSHFLYSVPGTPKEIHSKSGGKCK